MAIKREQVVQNAEKFVQRGKIEAAIREYKKLLEENPNDINTLNRVGDLYARIQRIDEAIDFFTQIAEQYGREGFFVKAIAIYKKIIKLDPTRIDVYESLAELYHKQGLVNEARTQYQVLADYYQKHENTTSAIAIFQKMAELEPENPSHRVRLAELFQQQKLTEKALSEYRLIAELMLRHGRAQEASRVYERALDLGADNLPFLADAARTLRLAGHDALAIHFLETAAESNPQARELLARLTAPAEEPAAPPPPPAPPTAAAPPPAAEPALREPVPHGDEALEPSYSPTVIEPDEIEIDLDDSFVLRLEDEDEPPASLVQPPADMLGAEPRRPAWARGASESEETGGRPERKPPLGNWAEPEVELEFVDEAAGGNALELPALDLDDPLAGLDSEIFEDSFSAYGRKSHSAEPPALNIDRDVLEQTVAGLHPPPPMEREEDLLSEAEVLAKYGLEEKALDRLSEALRINPDYLPAYGLMIQLHLNREQSAEVVELARKLAELSAESGEREVWQRTGRRLLAAGYRIEGSRIFAPITAGQPAPPATAAPLPVETVPEEEPVVELVDPEEEELEIEFEIDDDQLLEEPPPATVPLEPEPEEEVAFELVEPEPEPELEIQVLPEPGPSPSLELEVEPEPALQEGAALPVAWEEGVEAPPPPPVVAPPPEESHAPEPPLPPPPPPAAPAKPRKLKDAGIDSMLAGLLDPALTAKPRAPRKPAPPPSPVEVPPAAAAPPPPVEAPPPAAVAPPAAPAKPAGLGGLFDPTEISALVESEEIDWDDDDVSTAGQGIPPSLPAPAASPLTAPAAAAQPTAPAPAAEEPKSLDDSTMSWLDEADRRVPRDKPRDVFDADDDDFFDLAGQIEQELSQEGVFAEADFLASPQEQSLEEIVEGFKKGVAEHLSPTDFDTHFNLGIAYREMGLLEEAIGEFELSAQDAGHLVASCSMLGLCFLDRGLPEMALQWFKRGLAAPNLPPEEYLGMLYDLGTTYEALGDRDNAHKCFLEIYGVDTEYRDVASRLAGLDA